ncbi:mirror-image polydactyly gene 1 protein [Pempheris klunzingeri]|uniref:mirror-image polydactyly gene 1 protein n=1 Tax=Pempheris klunzingeri TaxID=3127111 RepID=UPI00397F62D2
MYSANPRVNVELQQRLPSPGSPHLGSPDRSGISLSLDHADRPQASCLPSPLSLRRSVSPVSPVVLRRSVSPVSPVVLRRSVSAVSLSSSRPPGGPGEMDNDLSPRRGPSPQAESYTDGPDGGRASRGPGSPALRRQLVSSDDSSHQDVSFGPITASGQAQSFDRDKNISFLLKELDALRDINKKLQEQLVQKEKELQRREVEEELKEEQREAQGWGRPAALMEEVLAAQMNRDQALMSRLLLANEERDEALLRARQLQHATEWDGAGPEDADTDVDELLRQICDADSVQEVQQVGSVLVQRLRLARQRRNDITAQEMKAVMEERDGSVAKCKRLEQDLIQEREQRAGQDQLLRCYRGKGGAPEDQWQSEAEPQVLRANHSSQDLLTPPPSSTGVSPAEAPPLPVQVQRLSKEKRSMEAELQRCQEAERAASERVHRLERLVEVLRKKVGAGTLRAVI